MSLLESLDTIVAERLSVLVDLGRVTYFKSPPSRPKSMRSLGIHRDQVDFEISVWESGEVELTYGTVDDPHSEHIDISSESELVKLAERLLELARTWPQSQ